MKSKKILIIGAGIGGMATANLLARAGHDVHVYEAADTPGGRAGTMYIDGFTFDTGPSWYLMPEVFEHYFRLLDEKIEDHLSLIKLNPAYKIFYETDKPVVITSNIETDAATFETIEKGSGDQLRRYVGRSQEIYDLALDNFLYSNFERSRNFLNKEVLLNAVGILPLLVTPIHKYIQKYVRSAKLSQILEYPMVFLGTSPYSAPAMYSLMSALDFKQGVFYPQGGIYRIIQALFDIGKSLGVTYHFDSPVKRIAVRDSTVSGISLEDKTIIEADIVISNADLHYTETTLLDTEVQSYPESYWSKKEAGPSALLLYIGVKGKIPEFEHHNLLLVDEWKQNFDSMYKSKEIRKTTSLYISKTSATDSTVAPENDENIFVLVPLPADVTLNEAQIQTLTDNYLFQIATMTGVDFKSRAKFIRHFGPDDFRTQYHSWKSSMLGQSHLLKQSAFFRTPNVSKKIKNLYYVGGSTTPGIGLPMCLISAELVYKRIIGDVSASKLATPIDAGVKD